MNARIMERVIAGGLWLTMVKPGWQRLIDWGSLDMAHSGWCVAGQVFADEALRAREDRDEPWLVGYDVLRTRYDLTLAERARLGFTTDYADDASDDNQWEDLRDAWIALWAPDPVPSRHVDYPHQPGTLYDCSACEASGELDAS